jgi:hypothetical protein
VHRARSRLEKSALPESIWVVELLRQLSSKPAAGGGPADVTKARRSHLQRRKAATTDRNALPGV